MALFLFFGISKNSYSLTIAEYIQQEKKQKDEHYQKFKDQWFDYLNEEAALPEIDSVAFVRKASEDYLISFGGLREKLGIMSKKNTYGFSFSRNDDEHRKASYHRAHRSIFMDINEIKGNQWLTLFVHEVAHSVDSEMFEALSIFNDKKLIEEIQKITQKKKTLSELSENQLISLEKWLTAGLNLGFLAEYRAWLLTYLIYEEGLADGSLQADEWLENLRRNRPQDVPLNVYIFRSLSPSWIDPTEGFFSSPIVKEALTTLRKKLYNDPNKVKLGQIGELINQF